MTYKVLNFVYKDTSFSFKIGAEEQIISESIDKTGVWESYQLDVYENFVPRSGVFVDVGANVGINSIYVRLIRPEIRIIAVEASTANFELLRDNTQSRNIECYQTAIADVNGVISFGGSGTNAHISAAGPDTEEVRARKLDTLMNEVGVQEIDLLKIDVEGFTDMVLSGADRTLRATKALIVEFSTFDIRDRFKCDDLGVEEHFSSLISKITLTHPFCNYISRRNGLVRFSEASDLMMMLSIEFGVGDVLFTRERPRASISTVGFTISKIHDLLDENHRRLLENRDLQQKLNGN